MICYEQFSLNIEIRFKNIHLNQRIQIIKYVQSFAEKIFATSISLKIYFDLKASVIKICAIAAIKTKLYRRQQVNFSSQHLNNKCVISYER